MRAQDVPRDADAPRPACSCCGATVPLLAAQCSRCGTVLAHPAATVVESTALLDDPETPSHPHEDPDER